MRIVVIDDDVDIRQLLTLMVPASGLGEVVGDAATSDDGVALVGELAPDVVVTDMVAAPGAPFDAYLAALHDAAPSARLVVFTGRPSRVAGGSLPGVDAYVEKVGGGLDQLLDTLRALANEG